MKSRPESPKQAQRRRCPFCKSAIHVSIDDKFLPHYSENSAKICEGSCKTYREACELANK